MGNTDFWRRFAPLCLLAVGCGPSALRLGPTLPTPQGEAKSSCERERWYEAAPAQVQAEGTDVGVGFNITTRRNITGLGLFRPGEQSPKELEDAWPRLRESELERQHLARIEPVDTEARHALYWALGGLAALSVGVGTAAATQDSHRTLATVFGLSGVGLGLVAVVGTLVSMPSGERQLQADARRRLFIQGEDNFDAVKRGVERNNAEVRAACGGR